MEIAIHPTGDTATLDLIGRLVVGPGELEIAPLRDAVRYLISTGRLDVAMDLSKLTYLDARGLGEIAASMMALRAVGGRMTISAASPRVARMLSITHLDTVLCAPEREPQLVAGKLA
jgi:anti-anti-sigma factor